MKAMILAAGEGTRLRPLTLKSPKVMLPIAGKPLLEYILDLLRFHGINEVAINLSHLPEVVMDWLGNGERFGMRVVYSVENPILGTAGALTRLQDFFDDTFVLIYGDMLMDLDISSLVEFHQARNSLATVTLFEVEDPSSYGIVEVDSEQRILGFIEKPDPGATSSRLANAGIYVLQPEIIGHIPPETLYDFGYDLFPALLYRGERLYGYVTTDSILDTGTMENYRRVERDVLEGRFSPKRASSTR
ncbi:MAG: nucleotidyltransferase family protein [Chloroflexi bacterium]|nr:nucleotidyltransferase family protein [Chloroflexota bacterium]